MAAAFFPQYDTTYQNTQGYNERTGSNISVQAARTFNGQYRNTATRHGYTRDVFAPAYPQREIVEVRSGSLPPLDGSQPLEQEAGASGELEQGDFQQPPSPQSLARSQTAPSVRYDANPWGRQNQIRHRTRAMEPWTFQVGEPHSFIGTSRAYDPPITRPGYTVEQLRSAANYGKFSVSRRLPIRERLRYHIPGYQGFVRRSQFLHGQTFGKSTRNCILLADPEL